jgi:hypothetical protein
MTRTVRSFGSPGEDHSPGENLEVEGDDGIAELLPEPERRAVHTSARLRFSLDDPS